MNVKGLLVGCIMFCLLSGCGEKGTEKEQSTTLNELSASGINDSLSMRGVSSLIAYIDLDSLLNNYDLYIDRNAELQAKAEAAEAELNNKGRSLENAYADASEKIDKGLVTRSEAMQLQEDLQKQEQSFYEHRDQVQMELAEESQVLLNNILNNIDEYLAEFNSDYKYGMILTTSGGTPVLHADPRLNITAVVLQGLNERYSAEKRSQQGK